MAVITILSSACSTSTSAVVDENQAAAPTTSATHTDQDTVATTTTGATTAASPAEATIAVTAEGLINPPEGYARLTAGVGSAFVIGPDGLAITRNHVVAAATTISTDAGPAEVLGFSECHDLAVLRIDAPDLPATNLETLYAEPSPSVRAMLPLLEIDEARDLVDRIADGEQVDSLGLNLITVPDRGLWVAGVEPGTAADQVGVAPRDFVVRFEDLDLWDNANQTPLCDRVESDGDGAMFEIFVNRSATGREWGATLNAGDTLERTGSQYPPAGYQSVQDPFASFFFFVPDAWDVLGGTSPFDSADGQVTASLDIDTMAASFDVGGVILARSNTWGTVDIPDVLDTMANSLGPQSRLQPSEDYDDGLYVGRINRYVGCGLSGAEVSFFAAATPTGDHLIYGFFQLLNDDDREAMRIVLDSLKPLP